MAKKGKPLIDEEPVEDTPIEETSELVEPSSSALNIFAEMSVGDFENLVGGGYTLPEEDTKHVKFIVETLRTRGKQFTIIPYAELTAYKENVNKEKLKRAVRKIVAEYGEIRDRGFGDVKRGTKFINKKSGEYVHLRNGGIKVIVNKWFPTETDTVISEDMVEL